MKKHKPHHPNEQHDHQLPDFKSLTDRELEIIQFLGRGYSSGEIAAVLYVQVVTISTHRRNLLKKTGARNTNHLIYMACKAGVL